MPPWWFVAPALGCSAFFGVFARAIFSVTASSPRPVSWVFYQFWFNFAGSIAGWCAFWMLAPDRWLDGRPPSITWGWVALAAVAFAGITGHLPFAFMEVVGGVKAVMLAVARAATKGLGS